jgi:nitroreductase
MSSADFSGLPAAKAPGEQLPPVSPSPAVLQYLWERRSIPAGDLGEPGPDAQALRTILTIAARVPDHKKLMPWRFLILQGQSRAELGQVLAAILRNNEPDASAQRLQTEEARFLRAPAVVAVISKASERPGVPEWEQVLSAGAVCLNLIHAAAAQGFSANWITEWYSYDAAFAAALRLEAHERIAGFIYLGTALKPPKERDRPDMNAIISEWQP